MDNKNLLMTIFTRKIKILYYFQLILSLRCNTNKANPIIEKIELTEEQKQEIRDVMDGKPTKKLVERWDKEGTRSIHERHYKPGGLEERLKKIRVKYFKGGKCAICQKFPLYKVILN